MPSNYAFKPTRGPTLQLFRPGAQAAGGLTRSLDSTLTTAHARAGLGPGLRAVQAVSIALGYPWMLVQRYIGLFRPLESSLLDVLTSRLDQTCSDIARSQLSQINRVQRITARRTECNFYRLVPFRVDLGRDRKFPFADSDPLLATVRFELGSGVRQVAKVYVVNGNLFSIEFGGDMRRYWRQRVQSVVGFTQHAACGV